MVCYIHTLRILMITIFFDSAKLLLTHAKKLCCETFVAKEIHVHKLLVGV